MPQIVLQGEVINAIGGSLGLRVENTDEMLEFWAVNQVDTKLDWFDGGAPVASINRQCDVDSCKPGDRATLTLITRDRSDGKRGLETIDFQVL